MIICRSGARHSICFLCSHRRTDIGVGPSPKSKRKDRLTHALEGVIKLFEPQIPPFDTQAARRYAELVVKTRAAGRIFPTPDGYIAAIASTHGFAVASRDTSAFKAARLNVIDPCKAVG